MKKKLIALLLCAALLVSLVPAAFAGAPAQREPSVPDALLIFGINIEGEGLEDPTFGGLVNYDKANNVLHLLKDVDAEGELPIYSSKKGLTISVDANVEVYAELGHAMLLEADTVITGSGRLAVSAPLNEEYPCDAISVNGATLTLENCRLYAFGSYALHSETGDAKLVIKNSEVEAAAMLGAIVSFGGGITLEGCQLQDPETAQIAGGAVLNEGGPAKEVRIGVGPLIPGMIQICGMTLTLYNEHDPTHDGKFRYDRKTNVLHVLGSITADSQTVIYSSKKDLTISIDADLTLSNEFAPAIGLEADTVITGPGKLTVSTTPGTENGFSAILLGEGAALELTDCDLDASGDYAISAWEGNGGLKIKNSKVHAVGSDAAIAKLEGGIWLTDCEIKTPAGATIGASAILDGANPAKEVLIEATDPKVYFTVTFEANGHGRTVSTTVESGKPVEKPADPTEQGWVFRGWYCEKECKTPYDFSQSVTADLTVYAKWEDDNELPPIPVDPPPVPGYNDIPAGAWYADAAAYVIDAGYMGSTSTSEKTFEPNTKVSRAMVASILYRIAGSPADVEYTGRFSDVPKGKWFTTAVEWCAQNGLASGKGDGRFDPDGLVTRQELAVFMFKLAEHLEKSTAATANLSDFPDVGQVPGWAASYLQWAVGVGLISGKGQSDGTVLLAPKDTAMRCELASILQRFLKD